MKRCSQNVRTRGTMLRHRPLSCGLLPKHASIRRHENPKRPAAATQTCAQNAHQPRRKGPAIRISVVAVPKTRGFRRFQNVVFFARIFFPPGTHMPSSIGSSSSKTFSSARCVVNAASPSGPGTALGPSVGAFSNRPVFCISTPPLTLRTRSRTVLAGR